MSSAILNISENAVIEISKSRFYEDTKEININFDGVTMYITEDVAAQLQSKLVEFQNIVNEI